MKRLSLFISVVAIGMFTACKEIGPTINAGNVQADPDDTTYVVSPVPSPEPRSVLIEEFTGVSCPNCPAGQEIIKSLIANNPGRVVSIGLYKYGLSFTDPRPTTDDDFRDSIANIIDGQIYNGEMSVLPIAGVDRVPYGNLLALDRNKWSVGVNSRLTVPSPVNLSVTSSVNDADNTVKVKFKATFTKEVSGKVFYSAAILEDKIIDAQEDQQLGDIEDYEHNHVLRSFISANKANGVELEMGGIYEPGRVFERAITATLKPDWKPENCKVVVFLHYSGANNEVLQTKEIDLK